MLPHIRLLHHKQLFDILIFKCALKPDCPDSKKSHKTQVQSKSYSKNSPSALDELLTTSSPRMPLPTEAYAMRTS